MANDLNYILITGRLAKIPTLKAGAKGQPYATTAVFHTYLDAWGEAVRNYFPVLYWGQEARAFVRNFGENDRVVVRGRYAPFKQSDGNPVCSITAEDISRATPITVNGVITEEPLTNQLTFSGRLHKDSEFRLVGKNKNLPLLAFTLRNTTTSAGDDASTTQTYLRVQLWDEMARAFKETRLSAGAHVTAKGLLTNTSKVIEKEDGTKTYDNFISLTATSLTINPDKNYKRATGAGFGAQEFEHPSRWGVGSRFTNELNAEVSE